MRSQNSSSDTSPAMPGASSCFTFSYRKVELREPPLPSSGSERGIPIRFMLYFTAGMPTAAQFSISFCTTSISRSRSGSMPSMMFGDCATSIGVDDSGSWIMSSSMPNELTCSRCFARSSLFQVVALPSRGSEHTLTTPSCAHCWKSSSLRAPT